MLTVHFGTNMGGDQPDDPLDLVGRHAHSGVDPSFTEPVEAQRPVRIDHDLDDLVVAHRGRNVGAESGDEHAALAFGRHRGGSLAGWSATHRCCSGVAMSVRGPLARWRQTWFKKATNRVAGSAGPEWSVARRGAGIESSGGIRNARVCRMS